MAGMQEGGRYSLDQFVRDIDAREKVRLEISRNAVVHAREDKGDDVLERGMCAFKASAGGLAKSGDVNRKMRVKKAVEGGEEKVDAA